MLQKQYPPENSIFHEYSYRQKNIEKNAVRVLEPHPGTIPPVDTDHASRHSPETRNRRALHL